MPRRFDARFFAAELPEGAVASLHGDEVVEQAWLRPGDALDAMAEGRLGLWPPTAATLQQLEHVTAFDQVREHLATGTLGRVPLAPQGPLNWTGRMTLTRESKQSLAFALKQARACITTTSAPSTCCQACRTRLSATRAGALRQRPRRPSATWASIPPRPGSACSTNCGTPRHDRGWAGISGLTSQSAFAN